MVVDYSRLCRTCIASDTNSHRFTDARRRDVLWRDCDNNRVRHRNWVEDSRSAPGLESLFPTRKELVGHNPCNRINSDPTSCNQEITDLSLVYYFPADAFLPRDLSCSSDETTFGKSPDLMAL